MVCIASSPPSELVEGRKFAAKVSHGRVDCHRTGSLDQLDDLALVSLDHPVEYATQCPVEKERRSGCLGDVYVTQANNLRE